MSIKIEMLRCFRAVVDQGSLADAAGTTIDRVAVHCVHQHNAPFACVDAEQIILDQGDLPHIVELDFFRKCLDAGQAAVKPPSSRRSRRPRM